MDSKNQPADNGRQNKPKICALCRYGQGPLFAMKTTGQTITAEGQINIHIHPAAEIPLVACANRHSPNWGHLLSGVCTCDKWAGKGQILVSKGAA